MQILGLQFGKKQADQNGQVVNNTKGSLKSNLNHLAQKYLRQVLRFQVSIIALVVAGLLTLTALRMLRYMNPPANDARALQDLAKTQQTHIDPKIVQEVQQLQNSGASSAPDIENERTNPFAE